MRYGIVNRRSVSLYYTPLRINKMTDKVLAFAMLIVFFAGTFFIWGSLSQQYGTFPNKQLNGIWMIADSIHQAMSLEDFYHEAWEKRPSEKSGIIVNTEKKADKDYVLFSSTHDSTIRMLDRNGNLKHTWTVKFNDIWKDQTQINSLFPLGDEYFHVRDFHLFENGDVLVMISGVGISPWGVGLVKIDKDSNIIWKHTAYVNNDFEIAPDGKIYAVIHKIKSIPITRWTAQPTEYLEDHIATLSPKGELVKEIPLLQAFENSEYKSFLKQLEDDETWDPLHTNSIHYIKETSNDVPWLKQGHLLLSVRNTNSLAVLDPETGTITYATGIPARKQHDVDLLENGNLLFFDNRGDFRKSGYSRIIEINPKNNVIEWSYADDALDSKFYGSQTRLENGNTFIVAGSSGRLIEVTPQKKVAWEYRIGLSQTINGEKRFALLTNAELYNREFIKFDLNEGK